MKRFYEIPELEILRFNVKDTLTNEAEEEWSPTISTGIEEW